MNEGAEDIVNKSEQIQENINPTPEPENIEKENLIIGDDNLSNIDLARALIQSDEKEKAKEVLRDIIRNGSASDAHEARILNLQIS